jgi:uncharacterized membrane protein
VYLGIVTAMSLGVAMLSVVLSNRIETTGGLSNMGIRSVLSTAKSLLPMIQSVVLLGLEAGYCAVTLRIVRGEEISTDTLFGEFRRFMPLVGAKLLQGALYLGAAALCLYPAAFVFLMLPASEAFYEVFTPLMESAMTADGTLMLDQASMDAMTEVMRPMLLIFAVMFLLLAVPMHYQFRLSTYRVVDQPRPRGMRAVRESRYLMRRNRFALFRLDLNFWWYYLLQVLVLAVCYGDMLLPLVGITLPWSDTVSYFVFLSISLALQFAVYYFFLNPVAVTYATAYEALLPKQQEETAPPAAPANPWQNSY